MVYSTPSSSNPGSLRTSLDIIAGIPYGAFTGLWPILWEKYQFLDTLGQTFNWPRLPPTLGFRRLLARAWVLPRPRNPHVSGVAVFDDISFPSDEGCAGGTLGDLASLVVSYIGSIGPVADLGQDHRLYGMTFQLVDDMDSILGHIWLNGGLGLLITELIHQGVIKSPTQPDTRFPPFPPVVYQALRFLDRTIPRAPVHGLVTDTLEAGLLNVIASCGAAGTFDDTLEFM
ncbi:hypothetical protein DFH07DRAFT_780378 [Mycena maculata]|uniref:Uncharacterized protein n=1 Tax=Mycena maculata TaxID=230809 RepID=A0AAD7MWT1_9AGAR|nr:hypothetical protein DFH07DRAFT_780378 [Mycena maculata]